MDIGSVKVSWVAVSQALLGKLGIQVVIEDSDPGTQLQSDATLSQQVLLGSVLPLSPHPRPCLL